ncbi:hypothetical protein [Streptomyces sp. NPDC007929]|uniref:hypothetical protein n=1 Tax=unclassified Streptomyces TaxID=2593676 RepID=UPI0036ED79E0
MADDGWYDDGDVVQEAARARRVAWAGMSVVTCLFGAMVLAAVAIGLAVDLALACALAVMD